MKIKLSLVLLLLCTHFSIQATVPQAERDALVALYNSTDGDNWNDNTNWLVGDPCDNNWYGVSCFVVEQITRLNFGFNGNNLTGSIPAEIGNLSELRYLNLSNNRLRGVIPVQIGNLTKLQNLYVQSNFLVGEIPQEIGNLVNLIFLKLGGNNLNGELPVQMSNLLSLRELGLAGNNFNSIIPSWIGDFSSLEDLNLSDNSFYGPFPVEITSLTNLNNLNLSGNKLLGVIPIEISNLDNLNFINLNWNALIVNEPSVRTFIDTHCGFCGANWEDTLLTAPKNLVLHSKSDSSISITWDVDSAFRIGAYGGYKVFISDSINGYYDQIYETFGTTEVAFTIGDLNQGEQYFIKAKAFRYPNYGNKNYLESVDSNILSVTTNNQSTNSDLQVYTEVVNRPIVITEGGQLDYKIVITNSSGSNVSGIKVRHIFPTFLTGQINYSCTDEPGSNCPQFIIDTEGFGIEFLTEIDVGSGIEINISGNISSINRGWGFLISSVIPGNGINDSNLNNNTSFIPIDDIFINDFE